MLRLLFNVTLSQEGDACTTGGKLLISVQFRVMLSPLGISLEGKTCVSEFTTSYKEHFLFMF